MMHCNENRLVAARGQVFRTVFGAFSLSGGRCRFDMEQKFQYDT
jgi:hypothetical protein